MRASLSPAVRSNSQNVDVKQMVHRLSSSKEVSAVELNKKRLERHYFECSVDRNTGQQLFTPRISRGLNSTGRKEPNVFKRMQHSIEAQREKRKQIENESVERFKNLACASYLNETSV